MIRCSTSSRNFNCSSCIVKADFAFLNFATKSPFDTVPGDDHSLKLKNLQVTIGGHNVLQSVLNYNCESFLEQLMYSQH